MWQTAKKFIRMAEKCIKIRSQYVCSAIYNTQSTKESKTEEYEQEISGYKFKKHSRVALNRLGPLLANTSQVKTGARHAPYLSRYPLTVHHASLNY